MFKCKYLSASSKCHGQKAATHSYYILQNYMTQKFIKKTVLTKPLPRTESKRLLRIRASELTTGIRSVCSALQNSTCLSCSFRRSSVTPRALIPRARQAACSSLTVRVSTPSSAIICTMERKFDRVRAQNRGTTSTAQPSVKTATRGCCGNTKQPQLLPQLQHGQPTSKLLFLSAPLQISFIEMIIFVI